MEKAKKSSTKTTKKAKRAKITPDHIGLDSFIRKVSKQVHPDVNDSQGAVQYISDVLNITFKKIMRSVNILLNQSNKKTIKSGDVKAAVFISLPGELAKHAVSQGSKALIIFNRPPEEKTVTKGQSKSTKTQRAKLIFPVTRIENVMRDLSTDDRIGEGSAVFMAAVLEYLAAELLELGGNAARDSKKKTISARHVMLAIVNDYELNQLVKDDILTCSYVPNIHSVLLPKLSKKKQAKRATN